ncbi:DUF4245 domain-containing protein [Actinoplanes sp. NPDC049265]|uniref:DUF4245 domain-containing protein n=1 Tax=Actinoplanes sp. NPDC049265 TaxID=3363902 RepID=UPI00371FD652
MADDAAKQPARPGSEPSSATPNDGGSPERQQSAVEAGGVVTEGERGDDQEAAPARLDRRAGRSPRDMVISLLVLLIPIALLLVFYRVVLDGDAPATVDPSDAIQQARAAAVFPVEEPRGLGDDWHTTSANWAKTADGATLRLGYVAPDDDSALVVQSSIAPDKLLRTELGDKAEPRGTVRAGNAAWRSYLARPGETALVLSDQTHTVIVTGNTDPKHLTALAAALN